MVVLTFTNDLVICNFRLWGLFCSPYEWFLHTDHKIREIIYVLTRRIQFQMTSVYGNRLYEVQKDPPSEAMNVPINLSVMCVRSTRIMGGL